MTGCHEVVDGVADAVVTTQSGNVNLIDIAALDPDGKNLILGECKYWADPVGINVLSSLEEKAKSVTWNLQDRRTFYVLFGANGFTPELETYVSKRLDVLLLK